MNYKYGVVEANGGCDDCDWEPKSYKNAQACAKIHAKKYKHHVRLELSIAVDYYGNS